MRRTRSLDVRTRDEGADVIKRVRDDPSKPRYELVEDSAAGKIRYRRPAGAVALVHTVVALARGSRDRGSRWCSADEIGLRLPPLAGDTLSPSSLLG